MLFLKHPSTLFTSPVAVSSLNIFTDPWHLISVSHPVKLRWISFHSSPVCATLGRLKLFCCFTSHVYGLVIIRSGREKDCGQIPLLSSLTCLFSIPDLLCFGDTHYSGVMTSSLLSLWSPRDSLAFPVWSPATAGIPGRAVLSRMADSIYAWDAPTHCVLQDTSQHSKGLIQKTVSSSSAVPREEFITNVPSPCNGR